MSKIDEGGAAFPLPKQVFGENIHLEYADKGITMRDYFAAAALQGLIFHNSFGEVSDENIAKGSYQYADAMIEATTEEGGEA